MTSYPKISIVTPSFNQGKYLERTITSVLDQGYPNLEYIIIDGGSTDNSVEIIRKYEHCLKYWVSEPDRGQSHAINKGFQHATGELLSWLNSDDYLLAGALVAVAEAYGQNPDAGAIVGAGEMVDENGNAFMYVSRKEITLKSLFNWYHDFFWQPSCFFTRKAWQECGPLDEGLHFSMDLDLWIRIAKKYKFATIPQNLARNLRHEKAKTTEFMHLSNVEAMVLIIRHGGVTEGQRLLEFYTGMLAKNASAYERLAADRQEELNRVFDELHKLKNVLAQCESRWVEHDDQLAERDYQLEEKDRLLVKRNNQLAESEQRLRDLLDSASWLLTAPFRAVYEIIKRLKRSL